MLIDNKHKIESDNLNVIVYRRGRRKDGSDSWRAEAYFTTVRNALTYLVDAEVRETGLRDFKQVTQKQDELYALIQRLNLPGEPPEVPAKPRASGIAGLNSVSEGDRGCNTESYDQNHAVADVTAKNKPNVTGRIRELAVKGMSSRAIAEVLQGAGIRVSHMTVARRLNDKGLATKDTTLLHNGGLNDERSE